MGPERVNATTQGNKTQSVPQKAGETFRTCFTGENNEKRSYKNTSGNVLFSSYENRIILSVLINNFQDGKYYIAAGITDLNNNNPYMTVITHCIIHPDFNDKIIDNDVAVLFVKRAIDFTSRPYIQPISCSSKPIEKDRICSVMGFGAVDESAVIYPKKLRTLKQTIRSSYDCDKLFQLFNSNSMFCAGIVLGEDTCIGDSGSPLVCSGVIYGVVSYGFQKCGMGPTVYANVSYFYDWIDNMIAIRSGKSHLYFALYRIINLDVKKPYVIVLIKCIIHPDYNDDVNDNDIGVWLLESSIDFASRPNIRPISYSSKPIETNRKCSVMGFGAMDKSGLIHPKNLRTLRQTIHSSYDCHKLFQFFNSNSMFCAGIVLGEDICIGDSGSPLVCSGVIYGVVSYGFQKCGMGPTVYANVSYFYDWIDNMIAIRSGKSHLYFTLYRGEIAKYGEFPYFVSVQRNKKVRTFTGLVHLCGGGILSEYVILTAAHCCFKKDFSSRKYYIAAGIINLDDANPYKIAVAKCIIHPDYNDNITNNDIAVLFVKRAIDFTRRPNIRPVLYSSKPIEKHSNCSVMGFGAIDENAEIYSPDLRTVMQTVRSSQFCGKFFKSFNPYSMFCAGVFLGEEGACIGDSGSPLVCSGVIYGVVSYGFQKCGMVPTVYANVSYFYDWIENTIAENGKSYLYFTLYRYFSLIFIIKHCTM
ncbi:transmembrane protease serine 9-like [Lycorma delicatula]|uniref:transmembrane protease serine 9-like n=1 Tax=Lycorma delicatula TaxID=130591 RepID=UPI003F5158F8